MIMFWNEESQKSALPLAAHHLTSRMRQSFGHQYYEPVFSANQTGRPCIDSWICSPIYADRDEYANILVARGATAWSRDIIEKHQHPINFPTRWAVCEDLIYSYPLGRKYRLMVAADANAYHNETYSKMSFRQGIFYGVSGAIMRYHFVRQNPDLKSGPICG